MICGTGSSAGAQSANLQPRDPLSHPVSTLENPVGFQSGSTRSAMKWAELLTSFSLARRWLNFRLFWPPRMPMIRPRSLFVTSRISGHYVEYSRLWRCDDHAFKTHKTYVRTPIVVRFTIIIRLINETWKEVSTRSNWPWGTARYPIPSFHVHPRSRKNGDPLCTVPLFEVHKCTHPPVVWWKMMFRSFQRVWDGFPSKHLEISSWQFTQKKLSFTLVTVVFWEEDDDDDFVSIVFPGQSFLQVGFFEGVLLLLVPLPSNPYCYLGPMLIHLNNHVRRFNSSYLSRWTMISCLSIWFDLRTLSRISKHSKPLSLKTSLTS